MQGVASTLLLTGRIDDHDDICRVVQLYIDGAAKGDVSKLKEAFHKDARMFGGFMGTRYDVPIAELFRCRRVSPPIPAYTAAASYPLVRLEMSRLQSWPRTASGARFLLSTTSC